MTVERDTQAAKHPLSLRLKLTLWMVVISLLLQSTLALVVFMYERQSVGQYFNERIQQRSTVIVQALRDADFRVTDEDMAGLAKQVLQFGLFERFIITLYDDAGGVVATNVRPAPPAAEIGLNRAELESAPFMTRQDVPDLSAGGLETAKLRLLLQRLATGDGRRLTLLVATTDTYFDTVSDLTLKVMGFAILIGVIAAAAGAWLIAGLAISPLTDLIRIAGTVSTEGIEEGMHLVSSSKEVGLLERELLDARSRLRLALQTRDRFVSNVSHELKTPIAVLLTQAQTLPRDGLPPACADFVQSVTEEMRRLGRMVESFLMLTKLHGGREHESIHAHDVNDFVMDAVTECHKTARQYGVVLVPQLAESDRPLAVVGDADLLGAMVSNLIHNAIRHSPERQRVLIRVAELETVCEVTVRDFGPGVPAEMLMLVFDRFVQAPDEAERGRGFGLGLSIAQGIAELHGGRITVRNLPDAGCEFAIRLPLAPRA